MESRAVKGAPAAARFQAFVGGGDGATRLRFDFTGSVVAVFAATPDVLSFRKCACAYEFCPTGSQDA